MKVHWPFNNHFLIRCCPSRPQFLIVSDSHKHLYSPLISYSHCFLSKLPPRRGRGLSGRHSCMDAWKALPLTPADLQSSHGCAASGICFDQKGSMCFSRSGTHSQAWGSKAGRKYQKWFRSTAQWSKARSERARARADVGYPQINWPSETHHSICRGGLICSRRCHSRKKQSNIKIWAENVRKLRVKFISDKCQRHSQYFFLNCPRKVSDPSPVSGMYHTCACLWLFKRQVYVRYTSCPCHMQFRSVLCLLFCPRYAKARIMHSTDHLFMFPVHGS